MGNNIQMCVDGPCICDPRVEVGPASEPVTGWRAVLKSARWLIPTDWWPVIALAVVCIGAVLFAWVASAAGA